MRAEFTHVAVDVANVDACVDFYRRNLGFESVYEKPAKLLPGDVVWMAQAGKEAEFLFIFFPSENTAKPIDGHFGFTMKSKKDVDEAAERALKGGYLHRAPHELSGRYFCEYFDPAKNLVQIADSPPPGMAIWPETTFSHITLDVADVEACAHFWEEHCTLRRVHRARGENNEDVIWLQEPGRERELAVALASAPDGYTRSTRTPLGPRSLAGHFGFSTKTMKDVDEGAAKAKKHGVLRRPAVNTPHPVGYLCEMEDPSGNVIELAYGQPPQSFNWPSFKREAEKHAMLAREHAERGDFGGAYRHGVYSAGLYPFDLDFVRSVKSWRSKAHAQTTELTELAFASAREENYSLAHRLGTDSLRVYPFDVLLQRAVREWQVKAGLGPAPSAVELEG